MKIDLLNINKVVSSSDIQEVKTATIFQNSNVPHPEGLASYEIFGRPGTKERQEKWGYIDLGKKFIHPQVYKILISLKRELYKNLINGEGNYTIIDGEIYPIMPGKEYNGKIKPGTGINWLYENWEKINFKSPPGTAVTTKMRKDTILTLTKDDIFIDKWLVLPAFYRDVDTQTNKRNEYNVFYSKLIRLSQSVKAISSLNDLGIVSEAEKSIQMTLFEMYTQFITFFCGSHGFVHEHVMGKPTLYSARLVISSGSFNNDDPELCETDHDHVGVPLVAVAKIFFPFMLYGVNKYIFDKLKGNKYIYKYTKNGFERKELHPAALEIFNPIELEKRIELYQNSTYHRLEVVKLRTIDDDYAPLMYLGLDEKLKMATDISLMNEYEKSDNKENIEKFYQSLRQPLTWMHLFYMVAEDIVSDKHLLITRYPIEDFNSIYPTLMNILPSSKYEKRKVDGKIYKRWPIYDINMDRDKVSQSDLDHLFVDTLKLHTTYLAALCADHDGDMVNCQGVYSDEANIECEKRRNSPISVVGINGECVRKEKDVLEHVLYALTYRYNPEMYKPKVVNY